jgi:hypothetical protein
MAPARPGTFAPPVRGAPRGSSRPESEPPLASQHTVLASATVEGDQNRPVCSAAQLIAPRNGDIICAKLAVGCFPEADMGT